MCWRTPLLTRKRVHIDAFSASSRQKRCRNCQQWLALSYRYAYILSINNESFMFARFNATGIIITLLSRSIYFGRWHNNWCRYTGMGPIPGALWKNMANVLPAKTHTLNCHYVIQRPTGSSRMNMIYSNLHSCQNYALSILLKHVLEIKMYSSS